MPSNSLSKQPLSEKRQRWRCLRKTILTILFSYLGYLVIRMIHLTCRYRFISTEDYNSTYDRAQANNHGVILATWHEHAILGISSHRHRGVHILISASRDGQMIARVAQWFGLNTVRGSSSRRASQSLRDLLRLTKRGKWTAFTVDGPKGPRHEVKQGAVALARMAKCPIIPFTAVSEHFWVLRGTWDQFRIPKPFSRVAITYGSPLWVEKGDDLKEKGQQLAQMICATESRASRYFEQAMVAADKKPDEIYVMP